MNEYRFKIGDRVRTLTKDVDSDAGQEGTVMENSRFPWVKFDKLTRYGSLPLAFLNDEKDRFHYDCRPEDDLELIATPEIKEPSLIETAAVIARVVRALRTARAAGTYTGEDNNSGEILLSGLGREWMREAQEALDDWAKWKGGG